MLLQHTEPEKVKRLGSAQVTSMPCRRRKPAEFNQPCLVFMKLKSKLGQSSGQRHTHSLRIALHLEGQDEVVGIANQPQAAGRCAATPLLNPQIQSVVQEHIGKQRADYSPNTKTNFQLERVVTGWRGASVLDLRRRR